MELQACCEQHSTKPPCQNWHATAVLQVQGTGIIHLHVELGGVGSRPIRTPVWCPVFLALLFGPVLASRNVAQQNALVCWTCLLSGVPVTGAGYGVYAKPRNGRLRKAMQQHCRL